MVAVIVVVAGVVVVVFLLSIVNYSPLHRNEAWFLIPLLMTTNMILIGLTEEEAKEEGADSIISCWLRRRIHAMQYFVIIRPA